MMILTAASVAARQRLALVDLDLAPSALIPCIALAREAVEPINAHPVVRARRAPTPIRKCRRC